MDRRCLHFGMPPGLRDRLADFGYDAPIHGVRPMTPVVVLVGAGIGVGLALVISGFWSTGAPVGRMSLTKRIDPANRQAATLRRGARPDRRTRHPLAGGRGHRGGGGLDAAVRPPAQHLPSGDRSPRGPGHLDRDAP